MQGDPRKYNNVLAESFCAWFCEKIFCQLCPDFWGVRGAYVDEIRVRLAENQPQKQVQERLRENIIIFSRIPLHVSNIILRCSHVRWHTNFSLYVHSLHVCVSVAHPCQKCKFFCCYFVFFYCFFFVITLILIP